MILVTVVFNDTVMLFLAYLPDLRPIRDLTEGKADLPFYNRIGRSAYQPLYI